MPIYARTVAAIASAPRFRPTPGYETDDHLLDAVRAVARRFPPGQRLTLSQAQFDAARAEATHPNCPTAKQVAARLRLSWADVLAIAIDKKLNRPKRLSKRDVAEKRDWTELEIADALQLVAARLKTDRLRIIDYQVERERILVEATRGRIHRVEVELPSDHQILNVVKKWPVALRLAGLRRSEEYQQLQGWPLKKAINWFVEQQGRRPMFTELDKYAKLYDVAIARREHLGDGKTFNDLYLEVMAERGEKPDKLPKYKKDRTLWKSGSRPEDAPHRKRTDWTRAQVIAALRRFLADRARRHEDGHPTTKNYARWLDEGNDGPHYISLKKHGGWESLLKDARRQRRRKTARKK